MPYVTRTALILFPSCLKPGHISSCWHSHGQLTVYEPWNKVREKNVLSEHYVLLQELLVKEPRTADFEFNVNEVQIELRISVRFSVLGLRVGLSNVSPCCYSTLLSQLLSSAGQERPWEKYYLHVFFLSWHSCPKLTNEKRCCITET